MGLKCVYIPCSGKDCDSSSPDNLKRHSTYFSSFRVTFAALLVLNYWLREFSLLAVADRFDLNSQPVVAMVFQNLSLFTG